MVTKHVFYILYKMYVYIYIFIYTVYMKSLFAKTDKNSFLTIPKNHVFSLCIPINLNETAVVVFLTRLKTKQNKTVN